MKNIPLFSGKPGKHIAVGILVPQNRTRIFRRLASTFISAAVLLIGQTSSAQTCPIVAVGENDGLAKSPQNFKLLFETEDFRVLEVVLSPNETQTMHNFTRPGILYLQDSIKSRTYSPGVEDPIVHEEEKPFHPTVARVGPSGLYAIHNLSPHPFRGLRVELKHPGCGLRGTPSDDRSITQSAKGPVRQDKTLYEDNDVRVSEVLITRESSSQVQGLVGFDYSPPPSEQKQLPNQASSAENGRIVPFAPLDNATEPNLPPSKTRSVIRFEFKYEVKNKPPS